MRRLFFLLLGLTALSLSPAWAQDDDDRENGDRDRDREERVDRDRKDRDEHRHHARHHRHRGHHHHHHCCCCPCWKHHHAFHHHRWFGDRGGRTARWEGPRRWRDRDDSTFAERMRDRRLAWREAREDRAAERDFPRRFANRPFADRRFERGFARDEGFADDEASDRGEGMSRNDADREDRDMNEPFAERDEAERPPRFDRGREERPRRFAARPMARAFDEEGPIARIVRRIDPETVGRFIERFADGRRGVDVDFEIARNRAGRDRDLWNGWDSPREAAEPSRDVAREPAMNRERESFEDTGRERRDFERERDFDRRNREEEENR